MKGWVRTGGLLLAILSLSACAPEPQLPTPSPKERLRTTAERAETEPERQRCVAEGGTVEHRGMFGSAMCVKPYPDAGKACSRKTDCEGMCLADTLGKDTGGTCAKESPMFGCFDFYDEQGQRLGICID